MTQPHPTPTSSPSSPHPAPTPAPVYRPLFSEQPEGPGVMGYLALVFAWAIPGVGHWMIGQRARGLVFGITIHVLFGAGLLIGGIRAINPPDQPIWTYTQFLTGWPMLIANRVEHQNRDALQRMYTLENQEYFAKRGGILEETDSGPRQEHGKAYIAAHPIFAYHPKVQDIGSVYCGIAGMLNLLVMFDVLLRVTGSVREEGKRPKRGSLVGNVILNSGAALSPAATSAAPTNSPAPPPSPQSPRAAGGAE